MKQGIATGDTAIPGAQAIRRAIDVIRAVAQFQRAGASLGRVAQATGLNQSTAFRILRSLTEERMLYFDEGGKCYHLGLLAFELGLATQGQSQVRDHFRPAAEEVARRTRLTTYLMARSGDEVVCLLCVQGTAMIRAMPLDVGQRLPLGIGAGSMAILATLDDGEIDRLLSSDRARLELFPGGRIEPDDIRQKLAAVRRDGFSVTSGSVALGLTGVGIPVLPRTGILQLAMSVSAAADTIEPAEARQFAAIMGQALRALPAISSPYHQHLET